MTAIYMFFYEKIKNGKLRCPFMASKQSWIPSTHHTGITKYLLFKSRSVTGPGNLLHAPAVLLVVQEIEYMFLIFDLCDCLQGRAMCPRSSYPNV